MSNFNISNVKKMGVPKGADRVPCIKAFEQATGIKVPSFNGRELEAESSGTGFFSLKGADIPAFVDSNFLGAGLTGTDSVLEYNLANRRNLSRQRIGDRMCRLVLMAKAEDEEEVTAVLNSDRRYPGRMLPVVTPLPNIVDTFANRDEFFYAFRLPEGLAVSGSFEVMPQLLEESGVKLVADLVQSGETAEANGLVEIMSLLDIYPEIIQGGER